MMFNVAVIMLNLNYVELKEQGCMFTVFVNGYFMFELF